MATHFSICAWEILWTKEPGGLQFMVPQTVRHDLATKQAEFQEKTLWWLQIFLRILFKPYPFPPFLHKPRLISASFPIPAPP